MSRTQETAATDRKFWITNIQRFSVNDGPGIRTTIFLKGCPLRCAWCHNPEAINPYQEFYHDTEKCVRCGACAEACPEGAITPPHVRKKRDEFSDTTYCTVPESAAARAKLEEDIIETDPPEIDRSKCTYCMKCVDACKYEALTKIGRLVSIDEAYQEVKADEMFYESSGGGMSVSGGEPLMQPDITLELLRRAKQDNFHTVIDTTGFAKWETLDEITDYVDLVLYDIKVIDEEKHKKWTGVSNKIILENARKLAKKGVSMRIRSLVVHNVNYWDLNYPKNVLAFAKELGQSVKGIDVLPYHNFAGEKYEQLGREYIFKGFPNLFKEDVQEYEDIINAEGFKSTIGGMIGVEQNEG